MPGIYPYKINYFDEEITTKISMKTDNPGFKLERKAMRILPNSSPEQKYLDTIEKQNLHEIKLSDIGGIFVDHEGKSLSGTYNFIITCEENPRIICSNNLNHSFCANGKKVIAAGDFIFQAGSLVSMSNNSGHYRPSNEEMFPVIKALYRATQGSLISYRSHCEELPVEYPILELMDAGHFSEVTPIGATETINSITGEREPLIGYDKEIQGGGVNRSFNRKLSVETMMKYQQIVDSQLGFFSGSASSVDAGSAPGLSSSAEVVAASH